MRGAKYWGDDRNKAWCDKVILKAEVSLLEPHVCRVSQSKEQHVARVGVGGTFQAQS